MTSSDMSRENPLKALRLYQQELAQIGVERESPRLMNLADAIHHEIKLLASRQEGNRPGEDGPQAVQHREEALRWFLKTLVATNGQADATDSKWNPLNVFCDDFQPLDTFNWAIERGFTQSTYDGDYDTGNVYLLDAGRAWLALSPPPSPWSGWRTIDSAPRDGTNIVVFAPRRPSGAKRRSRNGCLVVVAHHEAGWGFLTTPGDYQVSPTHWMPLPPAPSREGEGRQEDSSSSAESEARLASQVCDQQPGSSAGGDN